MLDFGNNPMVGRVTSLYMGRNVKVGTYEGQDELYGWEKIVTKGNGFSSVEDLTIGDKVTEICDYFCYGNLKLVSLYFPKNLKRIGNYAFYRNAKISRVVFNDGLKT